MHIYLDFSDLRRLIKDSELAIRLRDALKSTNSYLMLSPVHLFEIYNGPESNHYDDICTISSFSPHLIFLPSPKDIWNCEFNLKYNNETFEIQGVQINSGEYLQEQFDSMTEKFDEWQKFAYIESLSEASFRPLNFSVEQPYWDFVPDWKNKLKSTFLLRKTGQDSNLEELSEEFKGKMQKLFRRIPRSYNPIQEEFANGAANLVHRLANSRTLTISLSALNIMVEWLLDLTLKNRQNFDVYMMATESIIKTAWKTKTPPWKILDGLDFYGTSIALIQTVRAKRNDNKTQKVKVSDVPDMMHLAFVPYIDIMTVDANVKALISQSAKQTKTDFFRYCEEAVIGTGEPSIVKLIEYLEYLESSKEKA